VAYRKTNKVRAIAYSLPERSASFPLVPTFKELGKPEFTTEGGWFGIFAPIGTPQNIINQLHSELRIILICQR
jgi:tripartite-type tricarboxylate transporter receptor subunit TctC